MMDEARLAHLFVNGLETILSEYDGGRSGSPMFNRAIDVSIFSILHFHSNLKTTFVTFRLERILNEYTRG